MGTQLEREPEFFAFLVLNDNSGKDEQAELRRDSHICTIGNKLDILGQKWDILGHKSSIFGSLPFTMLTNSFGPRDIKFGLIPI